MARKVNNIVPIQQVEHLIYLLRGQKVMLDSDLAAHYGVEARVLNQAVKRNLLRFPEDFMFQLYKEEFALLMQSQIVTASPTNSSQIVMSSEKPSKKANKISAAQQSNSSQIVMSSRKFRGMKYRPFVFTEQGIAMLSSVLRSQRAVEVNIEIMRAFVKIRQWLASNADLSRRLDELEQKYDHRFKVVFDALRELMKPAKSPKREIGFHAIQPKPRRKNRALSTI